MTVLVTHFCVFVFLLIRSGTRPINHRNLISLTSGPEKYSPTATDSQTPQSSEPPIGEEEISSWLKDVLRAQEARERKPADLNEHVINLLDSFGQEKVNSIAKGGEPMAESAAGSAKMRNKAESHHLYSSHDKRKSSSFGGGEHSKSPAVKQDAPSKVPSLMATVLYPDRPSFAAVACDNNVTRNQFDQQRPRNSTNNPSSSSSSSTQSISPSRFARPPYSRW